MISLNIPMMTCQVLVLVWLFIIISVFSFECILFASMFVILLRASAEICLSIHLSKGSAWVSSWTQAQSACLPHSFHQHQIILLCYSLNGLFEGFYIQQRHDPELTTCQRELKFDVLPVTPPRYVTRLYVCRKNLWQVYQTDNSIVVTDLLYQTHHEIQITAGSERIPYRHSWAAEGKEKWGSNTPMVSAGARAYNGGLGAEPPAEVQGQSPQWVSRGKAPWSRRGFCV